MVKVSSLLLVVYLAFGLNVAFACNCVPPRPPAAAIKSADVVFSGTVTDISVSGSFGKKVTFDVAKTWKGINSPTISVTTQANSAACGVGYEVGTLWLVYAYGKRNLSTNLCSRTTRLQYAGEDLKVLGIGKNALPAPPLSNQRQSTGAWIALGLLAGGIALWTLISCGSNSSQLAANIRSL